MSAHREGRWGSGPVDAPVKNCNSLCAEMGGCYEGSPYCTHMLNRWDMLIEQSDGVVDAIEELSRLVRVTLTDVYPAGFLPELHQQILDLEAAAKLAVDRIGGSIEDARCEAKQYRVRQEA